MARGVGRTIVCFTQRPNVILKTASQGAPFENGPSPGPRMCVARGG